MIEVALRDVCEADREWLYELNREWNRDVVARQFGRWDEELQRAMFLEKWRLPRPAKILMHDNQRIGVVVREEGERYDSLHEVQVMNEYRGHGIRAHLILGFVAEARANNRRLRLQVLHENHRSKRFYERLGFREIARLENHYLMEV